MTYKSPPVQERTTSDVEATNMVRAGADFAVTRVTGGVLRQRYWTPDGRIILAVSDIRDYIRKDKDGKVIEAGKRDANLDKGWLLQPPTQKKLFCHWCDRWHDTQEQIESCKVVYEQTKRLNDIRGKNEMSKEIDEKDKKIDELTKKLEALTKLVEEKLR